MILGGELSWGRGRGGSELFLLTELKRNQFFMAKSTIEWTDYTFNPWWGCQKVSPACEHCYAETWAKRTGHPNIWGGEKSERRFFGDKHWDEPLKWNKHITLRCPGCHKICVCDTMGKAAFGKCMDCDIWADNMPSVRPRVFCASMADVFEERDDLIADRTRLFALIRATPNLDWLLLTKRPENWRYLVLSTINQFGGLKVTEAEWDLINWLGDWLNGKLPHNVWMGTTVENQEMADKRIPALLAIPAKVRFLSCEPLLGPVDLVSIRRVLGPLAIHWVIAGGESGPGARFMNSAWAQSLRDQCAGASVPFFFKQWGEFLPDNQNPKLSGEFGSTSGIRVGKKAAGRTLDGRTHDEFPVVTMNEH